VKRMQIKSRPSELFKTLKISKTAPGRKFSGGRWLRK